MATDVIMPQMGESIAEGTITRWIKNVGDSVSRDEPLFEISTDKVDAEIPSPAAGTLTEILVQPGQTVAVNTIVARIGAAGEAAGTKPAAPAEARPPEPAAAKAAPTDPAPAPAAKAPEKPAEKPPAAPPQAVKRAEPGAPPPAPEKPAEPSPAPAPAPAASSPAPSPAAASFEERVRTRSSPLVRKIAEENAVAITEVEGTGIAGRVTKNDLLSFIDNRKTAPRPAAPAPAATAAAPSSAPRGDRDEVVPMSVMRRKIAERMVESKRTSAHVATVFSIDYSAVSRLREKNKKAFAEANGVKLTYMPFIFQALTSALKKFPDLNASIDGEEIVHHRDIHLGMAVALDWGLIVPVIKNADEKSILGLARAANDLAERARSKKLKPEEVSGGTFTVTNPGGFGSLFGTPIIVQPQVAILGVGAIEKRAVVATDAEGNDSLAIRTMGYLALSFDHRLIDGAVADQFMAEVKKTLEAGNFSLA